MTVPDALTTVGVFGMGLIPSFIVPIADRPGSCTRLPLWDRLLLSGVQASLEVWLAVL